MRRGVWAALFRFRLMIPLDSESKAFARDLFSDAYMTKYLEDLQEVVDICSDDTLVLDLGCGLGQICYLLSHFSIKAIGIDIFTGNWKREFWSNQKSVLSFVEGAGEGIPLKSASVDVVVSYAAIEHVSSDVETLREAYRVIKPGGHLFIFRCPRRLSLAEAFARRFGLGAHERVYKDSHLRRLVERVGFKVLWQRKSDILPDFMPRLQNRLDSHAELRNRVDRALCRTPLRVIAHDQDLLAVK